MEDLDHSHDTHHHPPRTVSTLHEEIKIHHWLKVLRLDLEVANANRLWLSSRWATPPQREPFLPPGQTGRSTLRLCCRMLI